MLTRRTAAIAGLSSVLALGACGRTTRPERVDVIIIGAGLSGLNTALLLQELGLKVLVLEASAIAGGRVRTVETADGLIDVGASQIGRGYARVLDACRRFGLRLIAEDRDLRPFGMHFKDR